MTKMRDIELPLGQRIAVAMRRVIHGASNLRVPAEATDPDIVLSDCEKALDYYRAALDRRPPEWVPCLVLLPRPVRGDFPLGHTTVVEMGVHECESTQLGAITVLATNGQRLGIKPSEFEPLEWRQNAAMHGDRRSEGAAQCQ